MRHLDPTKHIPNVQDTSADFYSRILHLPLPWLRSRNMLEQHCSMRGSAFTMAAIVTFCRGGDNTWDPTIKQITRRSGLAPRKTGEHLRFLENTDCITLHRKRFDHPYRITILRGYLDWIYNSDDKYLEMPTELAVLLGKGDHERGLKRVSLLARCVAASIHNQQRLNNRIRRQNQNGQYQELGDPMDVSRIRRELNERRYRIENALSELKPYHQKKGAHFGNIPSPRRASIRWLE